MQTHAAQSLAHDEVDDLLGKGDSETVLVTTIAKIVVMAHTDFLT